MIKKSGQILICFLTALCLLPAVSLASNDGGLDFQPGLLSSSELDQLINRTVQNIYSSQKEQSYWSEPFVGDVSYDALLVAFAKRMGTLTPELLNSVSNDVAARLDSIKAGWSSYPGGPMSEDVTDVTLMALQYAGVHMDSAPFASAWQAFQERGGANKMPTYSQLMLSLLDLAPTVGLGSISPRVFGVKSKSKFNISRLGVPIGFTIPFVGISYLKTKPDLYLLEDRQESQVWSSEESVVGEHVHPTAAKKRKCELPDDDRGLQYLIEDIHQNKQKYENCVFVPAHQKKHLARNFWNFLKSNWRNKLFDVANFMIDRMASGSKEFWIEQALIKTLQLQNQNGGWYGSIFTFAAIRFLQEADRTGLGDFHNEINRGWQSLLAWRVKTSQGYWNEQLMFSGVWDTASVMTGLSLLQGTSLSPSQEQITKSIQWMESKAIPTAQDNGQSMSWSFDQFDTTFPDVDDTAHVIQSFAENKSMDSGPDSQAFIVKGLRWLVEHQNSDGGFPAWTSGASKFFSKVFRAIYHTATFEDFSQGDITGRVLTTYKSIEPYVTGEDLKSLQDSKAKACHYMSKIPKVKGLPIRMDEGHWMTDYVYGSANVLAGLATADCNSNQQKSIVEWMISVQNKDGGWGESNESFIRQTFVDDNSTISQSAVALAGLGFYANSLLEKGIAIPDEVFNSAEKAVAYLNKKTNSGANYLEQEFTGVLIKGTAYARYELLPAYTSLYALAKWKKVKGEQNVAKQ